MNRAIFVTIFLLVCPCWVNFNHVWLFAQTQTSVADTTKKPDQKLTPASEPAPLELPDVLIYGSDRSLRISGDKLTQPWDDAKAIAPRISYQPLTDNSELANRKNHVQSSTRAIRSRTLAQIDVGRFQKFNIVAGHWQEIRDYHFGFHGTYNRSSGQYPNSQFAQGALHAQFGFPIQPQISFASEVDWHRANYGLYGSIVDRLHRTKTGGALKLGSQWTIDTNRSAAFDFTYQQTNYRDRNGDSYDRNGLQRHIELGGIYQTLYWGIPAQWRAGYQFQMLRPDGTDSINTKNYFYLGATCSYTIKHYVTIQPSLLFENLDVNDSLSAYQLWPSLELVAMPMSQLGLRLKFSKELSPYNYAELIEKNPFLSLQTMFVPMRNELELRLGAEFVPAPKLSLTAELIRQNWRSFGYWARDAESGLMQLGAIDRVRLTTLKAQGRFRASPRAIIDAGVQLQFEKIHHDSTAHFGDRIPYLERLRVPLNCEYQIDHSTKAQLSLTVTSPRYADRTNIKKLAGLVLVSGRCDKQVLKHIAAYAEINNLFNQKYQLWENYPGLGFYVEIGLKGNW